MKKIVLENGLELDIDESALNNMELVDAMEEMQENELAISKALKLLLGTQNRKKLYDFLREEGGNVPIEKVVPCFTEILNRLGEQGKNS